MTEKQQKIIDEFIDHHGRIEIIETLSMIQLLVHKKTSEDIGISLHWLVELSTVFNNVSIGTTTKKNVDYCMYITMFKYDDCGNEMGL